MKKYSLVFILIFALLLSGCGVDQKMADKINEKVNAEGGYTSAQLLQDYKNPTLGGLDPITGSGLYVYVDGCDTKDEADQKYKNGEEINAVYVYVAFNKVTSAKYKKYSPNES